MFEVSYTQKMPPVKTITLVYEKTTTSQRNEQTV